MTNIIRDHARTLAEAGISLDQVGTVVEELVEAMAEANGYEPVTTGDLFGPTTMAYFRKGWVDPDTRTIITVGEAASFGYYTGFDYVTEKTVLGRVTVYEECDRVNEAIDRSGRG